MKRSPALLILLWIGALICCTLVPAVSISLACSQPPTPVPSKAPDSYQSKIDSKKNVPTDEQREPATLVTSVDQLTRAVEDGVHTYQKNSAHDDSPSQWWTIVTNIVIAAFTIVLAFVAGFQYQVARDQKRALKLAERAELQITDINMPPGNRIEHAPKLQIAYKNFGRTVATEVIANVRFHEMIAATSATIPSILPPQDTSGFAIKLDDINGTLGTEKRRRFAIGQDEFRVMIELSFTDIFGERSTTVYDIKFVPEDNDFTYMGAKRKQEQPEKLRWYSPKRLLPKVKR